jgi:hypothetical protein
VLLLKSIRRHQNRLIVRPEGFPLPFTFIMRSDLTHKHSHTIAVTTVKTTIVVTNAETQLYLSTARLFFFLTTQIISIA